MFNMLGKFIVVLLAFTISILEGAQLVLYEIVDYIDVTWAEEEIETNYEESNDQFSCLGLDEVEEENLVSDSTSKRTHIELLVDKFRELVDQSEDNARFVFTYVDDDDLVDLVVFVPDLYDSNSYYVYVLIADQSDEVVRVCSYKTSGKYRTFEFVFKESLFYTYTYDSFNDLRENYVHIEGGEFNILLSRIIEGDDRVRYEYATYKDEVIPLEEYEEIKKELKLKDFSEVLFADFYYVDKISFEELNDTWHNYVYVPR